MFRMQGKLAELWSQGHQVGMLRNWLLISERPDHFVLTGVGELPLLTLPESLRPPLEVRIHSEGAVNIAPVRAVGQDYFIGLARLQSYQEVL